MVKNYQATRVALSSPSVVTVDKLATAPLAPSAFVHLLLPRRPFPNPLELAFSFATRTPTPSARCRRARRAVSPRRCSPWPPAVPAPSSSHIHPSPAPIDPGNGTLSPQRRSPAGHPLPASPASRRHGLAPPPPLRYCGDPSSGLHPHEPTRPRVSPSLTGPTRPLHRHPKTPERRHRCSRRRCFMCAAGMPAPAASDPNKTTPR